MVLQKMNKNDSSSQSLWSKHAFDENQADTIVVKAKVTSKPRCLNPFRVVDDAIWVNLGEIHFSTFNLLLSMVKCTNQSSRFFVDLRFTMLHEWPPGQASKRRRNSRYLCRRSLSLEKIGILTELIEVTAVTRGV